MASHPNRRGMPTIQSRNAERRQRRCQAPGCGDRLTGDERGFCTPCLRAAEARTPVDVIETITPRQLVLALVGFALIAAAVAGIFAVPV